MKRKLWYFWGNDPGEKHIEIWYIPLLKVMMKIPMTVTSIKIDKKEQKELSQTNKEPLIDIFSELKNRDMSIT